MRTDIDATEILHVIRGPMVESSHRGHVAVWHHDDGLVASFGDPGLRTFPRSAVKMIQALPLVESGAADAAGLSSAQLALACASHRGMAIHTDMVLSWLSSIGRSEADLRCGAHWPYDDEAMRDLVRAGGSPAQRHNNCSGKHTGFLTLARHLEAGPEYLEIDHPVQRAVRSALEELSGETCDEYGIDGCSAPNFVMTLSGFARALSAFAAASDIGGRRGEAMARLTGAMMAHPEYVAGEGQACTRLMRAMEGRAAIKTGAEGVFAAIVPEKRLGIAVKIEDGATRASEAAIARLLVGAGVLDPEHPDARALMHGPTLNRRGIETGHFELASPLAGWRL
ncbi:asparaginase [Roseibacterium sp. SDUM158017]|uniref:asparaginase n=1 Tax=Roseicyclus salinarum TaxID=3036773 RepID=UPI00241519CB|nr:asparaginase [Roseibacterium sp. SDUM158017]MDG4647014.1 asparaginase [Roseibacterium sp. SDUM158017]